MYTLYAVRLADGRLATCASTHEHAWREAGWLRASGVEGRITVEPFQRDPDWGAPKRFVGRWCSAKVEEFKRRYEALEPVKDLAIYFDTSLSSICKKAREYGFTHRIDDPRTFERHRGRWTEREHKLVNLMYDEGIGVTDIPSHHPRTKKAVTAALNATARTYSTRSRFGRFIAVETGGHRKKTIHRVLEAASESSFHSDEGDA